MHDCAVIERGNRGTREQLRKLMMDDIVCIGTIQGIEVNAFYSRYQCDVAVVVILLLAGG